jgi:hypothetical protein
MTEELDKPKTFEQKMYERIRDSIGDLMSDKDLKKLVDSAVQKAFFEERTETRNYNTISKPSWMVEKMTELLRDNVTAAVKEWIEAHPDEVTKAINEAIAKGMFGLVVSYFDSKVNWPLQNFAQELRNKGML